MKGTVLAAIIGILLMGMCTSAFASKKVTCEVLTIEASTSNQGIDPALSMYASIFNKPPFNTYNTFRLIHRKEYPLVLGTPKALNLPSDLRGTLRFNGVDAGKLTLTLTLERQDRVPAVIQGKATQGTPFFAAGLKSANGRWVFAVNCNRLNGVILH